eukprot:CAMPEP_0204610092 /NCGR_PEP_ID=MMETSP0661-20131031/61325_1 /ASSEMBLY_ACC=CAM_ASM_000606 /TAXON_ID=109239 /ORGANISM="Alexandrium margalefi, Strain AMGDE01CS-322" /LENGTH=266 /DNA_ID=CAMNT_0051621891 /DNA_START=287 /DNA_END=1088 /DNA_ORIENTATION=-
MRGRTADTGTPPYASQSRGAPRPVALSLVIVSHGGAARMAARLARRLLCVGKAIPTALEEHLPLGFPGFSSCGGKGATSAALDRLPLGLSDPAAAARGDLCSARSSARRPLRRRRGHSAQRQEADPAVEQAVGRVLVPDLAEEDRLRGEALDPGLAVRPEEGAENLHHDGGHAGMGRGAAQDKPPAALPRAMDQRLSHRIGHVPGERRTHIQVEPRDADWEHWAGALQQRAQRAVGVAAAGQADVGGQDRLDASLEFRVDEVRHRV